MLDISARQTWPAAVGPAGPYGGSTNKILIAIWVECAVTTLLILLRFYTRFRCGRHGGWALSWTTLSWAVGLVAQVLFTYAAVTSLGGFTIIWTVPIALMWTWISIYLTFIAIGLGKFAVVAFILSLQGTTHPRWRFALYFLAASNLIIDAAFVLFLALRCTPPSLMWDMNTVATCAYNFDAAKAFAFFTGSWNAATDLILALYPLFLFRTVPLQPRVKLAICGIMSLGVISCICAALKTWDIRYVNDTTHLSFELFCFLIWTYTEMWAVLLTSSIAPLWPLFKGTRTRTTTRATASPSRNASVQLLQAAAQPAPLSSPTFPRSAVLPGSDGARSSSTLAVREVEMPRGGVERTVRRPGEIVVTREFTVLESARNTWDVERAAAGKRSMEQWDFGW